MDTSHMIVAEDNEDEIQPDMTTQSSFIVIEENEGLELKMPGEENETDEDEVNNDEE